MDTIPTSFTRGSKALSAEDLAGASCSRCGCTEAKACERGCCWIPAAAVAGFAVCSACVTMDDNVLWQLQVLQVAVADTRLELVALRTAVEALAPGLLDTIDRAIELGDGAPPKSVEIFPG